MDLPAFCFHYSKSSGSAALLALSWTCLLVRTVFPTPDKRQGETWKKLVGSSWFAEIPLGVEDLNVSNFLSLPKHCT